MHVSFIIIAFITCVRSSTFYQKLISKVLILYAIMAFLILVNIDRNGGDIRAYEFGFNSASNSIYFIREFLFWYPIRFVHNIFKNLEVTLFIFDIVCISVICISSLLSEKLRGFTAIYIASFPALFFHENVLRQGLATSFLILFLVILIKKRRFANYLIYPFLIFIHNFTILFLPFLYNRGSRNVSLKILFLIIFTVLVYFGASTRNSITSGLPLDKVFHVYFILLLLAVFLLRRKKLSNNVDFLLVLVLLFSVMLGFALVDSQYERFSYTVLLIIQVLLMSLDGFKYKLNYKIMVYGNTLVLLLPKFISASSLRLIAS